MATKLVIVDYENIQNFDGIDKIVEYDMKVFVGKNQTKIPIDLVFQTQQFGKTLEWIKVNGQGKNALDYDPLMDHINEIAGKKLVKRVANLEQVGHKLVDKAITPDMKKLIEHLKKIEGNKRPKKKSTLMGFAMSIFVNQKSKEEIDKIIEGLYVRNFMSESNGVIKYQLDNVTLTMKN